MSEKLIPFTQLETPVVNYCPPNDHLPWVPQGLCDWFCHLDGFLSQSTHTCGDKLASSCWGLGTRTPMPKVDLRLNCAKSEDGVVYALGMLCIALLRRPMANSCISHKAYSAAES